MAAQTADNIDLRTEKIIRYGLLAWLGILTWTVVSDFGDIPNESWTLSLRVLLIGIVVLFVMQAVFVLTYRRLSRQLRSTGMVINYLVIVINLLYAAGFAYLLMEGRLSSGR